MGVGGPTFHRPQAELQAVVPAGRAFGPRGPEPDRGGLRRPMNVVRNNGNDAAPTPACAGVTGEDARGGGRGVNNVFEPYS